MKMKNLTYTKNGSLFIEIFFILLLVISFVSYVSSEIDTTHEILTLEKKINSKHLFGKVYALNYYLMKASPKNGIRLILN